MIIYFKIVILVEWETENGCIVALCNKMYFCFDEKTGGEKRSTKGIPHKVKIELDRYKDCLFNSAVSPHTFQMNSLRLDIKKQMCRTTTTKRGISDIFIKLRTDEDAITCTPLMLNEKYI